MRHSNMPSMKEMFTIKLPFYLWYGMLHMLFT